MNVSATQTSEKVPRSNDTVTNGPYTARIVRPG